MARTLPPAASTVEVYLEAILQELRDIKAVLDSQSSTAQPQPETTTPPKQASRRKGAA